MIPPARVERTLDAPSDQACPPARVHAALRSHAVPARDWRRDGLLRQLGDLAAARVGRSVLLPQALRDLRSAGADRAARDVKARAEAREDVHAAAADRGLWADRGGEAARSG